jgi:LacI family transcriptional regulator
MAVTLKDIAKHTGFSITTISRALAGYSDVSPATRQRVREVADQLGYQPNLVATAAWRRTFSANCCVG